MTNLSNIGQPIGHVEGPAKVTGHAQYAADVTLPGLLWGKCLRSPFPHAHILSIDVTQARQLPGVHAVLTSVDLPATRLGRFLLDIPILARDRVRFVGEKVVAVAADSPDIAEEALALIDVQYEELPAVFDPVEAMQTDAPRIHAHPESYGHPPIPEAFLHGGIAEFFPPIPNVVSQVVYRHGDLDAGFAQADRVFEHTIVVPAVHQGYIEPHACLVSIEPSGKINVWLSNKMPFLARSQFAAALGIPEDRVRVNPVSIGGDFGGKGSLMDSILCYHLAQQSGRPPAQPRRRSRRTIAVPPPFPWLEGAHEEEKPPRCRLCSLRSSGRSPYCSFGSPDRGQIRVWQRRSKPKKIKPLRHHLQTFLREVSDTGASG